MASGGLGNGLQVGATELAQVLGVDGLRLLLRQVAEAPVGRVGLQQRVVGRAAGGAVVPAAELLFVEDAGLDTMEKPFTPGCVASCVGGPTCSESLHVQR